MKSEKNKCSVRLLPVIMAILLLLCGCGANTNQTPYETIPEGKAIPREENTASNECFQIDMEEDSSNVEEVFRNQVCGVYTYEPDDAEEKRYFEISHMDGQFYLEYIGQYDYAGAELEILNMDIKNSSSNSKRIDFEVMIYPFSGFSFEGEYWGAGNKAIVTKWADENLQLSEGQPFFSGECIQLTKAASDIFLHPILETKMACAAGAELYGFWRCVTESDGEIVEVFLSFSEDGTFKAAKKKETYPPEIYVGIYMAEQVGDQLSGYIRSERFAYGSMPFEWIFTYDRENDRPVIVDEYFGVEPFTFQEENLPYERTKSGDRLRNILPGPGERAKAGETIGYSDIPIPTNGRLSFTNTIDDLRLLAATNGDLCAAAFLGYGTDIASFLEETDPSDYPFLWEIPKENYVAQPDGGNEIYCIIPTDMSSSLAVNEWIMDESNGFYGEPGQVLYRSEEGEPILLCVNPSDVVPGTQVTIVDSSGEVLEWNPSISLYDGTMNIPWYSPGVSDFTDYSSE